MGLTQSAEKTWSAQLSLPQRRNSTCERSFSRCTQFQPALLVAYSLRILACPHNCISWFLAVSSKCTMILFGETYQCCNFTLMFDYVADVCLEGQGDDFLHSSQLPVLCQQDTLHTYLLNKWSVILGIHWYLSGRVFQMSAWKFWHDLHHKTGLGNIFFLQSQIVNIFGYVGPTVYVSITQLCGCRAKIIIDNT